MGKLFSFGTPFKRSWFALCLALSFYICLCNAECLSKDSHLKCFSKDLLLVAESCLSSSSASSRLDCKSILPKGTGLPWSAEWVSTMLAGAWYRVVFSKAYKMNKVIIRQRSKENSQIKEVDIEFDTGPNVQMALTQNVGTNEIFDEKRFVSRSSSKVQFTVLSMHTDGGPNLLPGFKTVQIYDETCDRDYQELNMEHHSLSSNTSLVRSWSPFTGFLKMYLSFYETLTLYLADVPSIMASTFYQFVIDTRRKELGVYKVSNGVRVEMVNQSFSAQFYEQKRLFVVNRNETHWIIGGNGLPQAIEDSSKHQMKFWGIACSSLNPVKLTFWKHIGKCYEKADYYWLADKLIGGTRIAELRQGKDGRISSINDVQALPFGPFVDGHTSSSLHLTGKSYSRLNLAKFHEGCFSDITSCTSGFTMAFWLSTFDASPADALKDIIRLSGYGFSLRYKHEKSVVVIRTRTKDYDLKLYLGRTNWSHVFIFWDPVNGVKALVNNIIEINGTESIASFSPSPGFKTLDVGRELSRPTQCARIAFRDLALWERRLSLDEAREYYHCSNFEIPREFVTNRRSPSTLTGTFPFPEQNVAALEHGGTCTSPDTLKSHPCSRAIDGKHETEAYRRRQNMMIVMNFNRVYVVNKVVFRSVGIVRNLTMTFADGTSEKFAVADPKYQEIRFQDKTTDSITMLLESPDWAKVSEIGVYYDFSKDRLPSGHINWAYGSQVMKQGSTHLVPFLTDGSTSDDSVTAIRTAETTEARSGTSGWFWGRKTSESFSLTPTPSHWIRIVFSSGGEAVKVNLIRLWLVYNRSEYDSLKRFRVVFSDGSNVERHVNWPGPDTDKTYWREFVFTPVRTNRTDLYFLQTYALTRQHIGIREVEVFYDPSKDLPASKTIIDEHSVHTWEEGLSSAKFGTFDFLLNIDVSNMGQANMAFLGRKTGQDLYRTLMRTTSDWKLFVRIGTYEMVSGSDSSGWHNIKLFYNAGENRLSLFINNRLESALIALIPEEPDGWEWETGVAVNSQFTGSLKNFRIHQAVRSFGMASRKIPASALSVSSALNYTSGADMARLNSLGAWIVAADDNDQNQYLQVDLALKSRVMYVAFQGSENMWVTWARVAYSTDAVEWQFLLDIHGTPQLFRAAHDADSVAMVMLYKPVVARYIRIYPYLANVGIALRIEVYDHDYGLPFNSRLRPHVPSYKGCIKRNELFRLDIFFPLFFKSLASTPDDCISACALQGYKLAGLFQGNREVKIEVYGRPVTANAKLQDGFEGAVCYCTEKTLNFAMLSDDYCSFPCPGNSALRCGGETTISLYDASSYNADNALCTDCAVQVNSKPLIEMFTKSDIFVKSSGNVSSIDVSLNGVHMANVPAGAFQHRFVDYGKLNLIAEARDSEGRQVTVGTAQITVQHRVSHVSLYCPKWVFRGDSFECYLYVQRGTSTEVSCTINGEHLPLEIDDNMLVKSGDIIPEYPVPLVNDANNPTIMLPGQTMPVDGIVMAFEFVTTGPGRLTIKLLRPKCGDGMSYCQTKYICMLSTTLSRDCPQSNPPTTENTFPSTGKVCDTLDAYCPTRKLPSNLTTTFEVIFEDTVAFSEAGVHTVIPPVTILSAKAGDLIAYSGAINLQHKTSGVSFRAESSTPGFYTLVERLEARTALLRAHVWKYRNLYFVMNKPGQLECSAGNDLAPNSGTASTYIAVLEKVTDVILIFPNFTATNDSVLFVVPPHLGGDVTYTFRFAQNKSIVIANQNSSHTLTFNYTFTESGYHHVNLTVANYLSSVDIFSSIRIVDAIKDFLFPCPFYAPLNEVANIVLSAASGKNVTIIVQFGDETTTTVGPVDFVPGAGHSVPHTYEVAGSYNVTLFAENAVSSVSVTGLVHAMETVRNVTVTMETEIAFVDVPVVLSASVSQGADVQYLAIFSYSGSGVTLPEMPFTDGELNTTFTVACLYHLKVLAFNNVSSVIYNCSLLVEDPVIVNLRATVGLAVAGEPTVLTALVDSGLVSNCTWDFDDGRKETLPFGTHVQHVYRTGGKYVVNLNCSNPLKRENASSEVEVLVYIDQLDISVGHPGDDNDNVMKPSTFPVEDPLMFYFTTNGQFVNFTVDFGDFSPALVTEETSIEHLFPAKYSSYDVTVNVSNAISHKVASISVTLLQSVKDIVLETNGPVKRGEEVIFTVTMGQMGTFPCYYFDLGDGHELIYKGYYQASCPPEYAHVTDIRFITSQAQISFAHNYTNITIYDVSCVGSNPVSSERAETQAVILELPCNTPIVSIEELTQNVDDAREFMRSEEFELITKNSIDCDAASETNFKWKVFKVVPEGFSEDQSVEMELLDIKTDDWKVVFNPRTLEYGLYYISFTLTMVGVEGVSSTTFGYVRITPSPIVAEVRGGSTRVFGFDKLVMLDGGTSRDPDVEEGDYEGMYFYWHCKRSDDNYTFPFEPEDFAAPMVVNRTNASQVLDFGGCFGQGPGRLNFSESMLAINIDTGLMRENASYTLQLLVKKDVRRSVFNLYMDIIPGNPPTIALICLWNCLEKFNPTVKVSLEATCQNCRNVENLNYRWEVYLHSEGSWVLLENIDDAILTRPSSPNLVIKEEWLLGNRTYKFRVLVWRSGGIPGIAEFIRMVNIPPFGGWCFASPKTGYALDTRYGVTCGDWIDDNLPLKYTFSYFPGKGTLESLIYVGENSFSPNTTFPTGQEENNTLYFLILITDSLEASTLVELKVQVNPTNAGALKSQVVDLTSSNGTLGTLISSGDTQNAFQMISAVGNMLNFESEKRAMTVPTDGGGANGTGTAKNETTEQEAKLQEAKEENTKLRTSLVNVISKAKVNTLEDAQRTSSVLGTVTKETDEVSAEAQDTATSTLATVGDVLENAAEKPGIHPRTVAKTAESVLSGIGNVIQAAFYVEETLPGMDESESENNDPSQESESTATATDAPSNSTDGVKSENDEILQEKQRKKELANKLMSVVKTVAKAVTTSKAPGEQPTRIDTPHLSLEVYRENPADLTMKLLTAGSGSFSLPEMGTMLNGSGVVDVSTVATATNPFEDEDNRVHSIVMTTEFRNASGAIGISDMDDPIDIRLPRDPVPVFTHRLYQAISGKMIFHKFQVTHNDSSINIDLHLVGNCSERANFTLFLQKGQKPSVQKHMFNATIPDPQVLVWQNVSKSENTFFISNVDLNRDAKGTFYLGIMYNRPDLRCPEFMNYTVNIFTSGCLYFDEERNVWKGDGCTVGLLTNANETHCLCNHLTSFGGDFVVAPNSIDWDAVSAGFTNLDENPVVFAVVVSIIAVYFIVLLWVRRLDKKDLKEFVTIPLPDNDPRDNYNYEVVVYTGHSKHAGTTAKVFIVMSGSLHDTEPRALLDSAETALKSGGVDAFTLSVPSSLGKLDHVRVWHDNSGDSPTWYLNRILVRDVQTNKKTWFLCDQWLAVEEDDGLIERSLPAATKDDLVSFNFLFSVEARRKLFEEHLWFSVLSRRPRNQFTRAQRLSCCLSVLLSTMLANAMFYQTDDSSSSGNQIRAGPLVFSLKQLWIGFISCLVVLPVNVLIMYIFRNVRPSEGQNDDDRKSDKADKYAVNNEGNESEVLSDPTENLFSCSKISLPRKFIYVAYILLFLTISVSATFTIFYGFTFGKEKSEKWISSTLLSFFQDLMLLQPLKVFAAATFIALILKDPSKLDEGDKSDSKPDVVEQVDGEETDEEQLIAGDDKFRRPTMPRSVVKPPAESDLVAVRELRTKQKLMRRIVSEVCWYIAYLVLISVVAYGNRDPKAYFVTRTMNDMFVENKYTARMRLDDVSTIPKYWSWLYNSILPAMDPPYWYGPYGLDDIEAISKTMASKSRAKAKSKTSKTKSSGSAAGDDELETVYHNYPKRYTADRAVSYVVGLARARQLRNAPQDSCSVHPTVQHLHPRCSKDYSWSNEDEGCYNVSWSHYNGSKHSCKQMTRGKSPWKYHSAWDLKGTPFWGKFHNYWGGGYVWNLDSSLAVVQKESKILEEQSWLDHNTRAVFFEFTIYNAFTNFFCSVTLLLEKQITGGIHPYGQLHSLRLYHYVGAEAFVTLVCEIIFVGVLCYIFMRELKEARSNGIKKYFKDPWNYFDILGLVFSFTAIGLYFARMAATSLALERINENHNTFVSFHYVSAIDQSFTILLGLAIFVYFLKVLRLLRFNRKISLLSTTLIACTDTLLGFMLTYMLLFAAYAQIMYLVYGRDMPEFASYQRCLSSLMEMTLGSSDFDGMNATQRILTGFIFFSYTLLNMCVYMNLFISILSETFSEVRADVMLQPNDHEIVDFMVKSLKKAFFSAVEPVTNPMYKEPKDDIDLGVDKISETSECIEGALRALCKEDIRQTLWFEDKSKRREKRILLEILCESGEIFSENDFGDAVPLFDDVLKKFSVENLLVIRDNQRRKIASDLAKSISSSRRRTRLSSQELSDESEDGNDGEVAGAWDSSGRFVSGRCLSRFDGGDDDGGSDCGNDGFSGDGDFRTKCESEGRYSDRDCDDDDDDDDDGKNHDNGDTEDDVDGNGIGDYDSDARDSDRGDDDLDGHSSDSSDDVKADAGKDKPPSDDGVSDSDNNHSGSDDGAHSETDNEVDREDYQPNQDSTIELREPDGYDETENAKKNPRTDACVFSTESEKED